MKSPHFRNLVARPSFVLGAMFAVLCSIVCAAADPLMKHHPSVNLSEQESPVNLQDSISWNEKLYFTHESSGFGSEPWVSDGSIEGTKILADIAPLEVNSLPRLYTSSEDGVFFVADNLKQQPCLCKIDQTDRVSVLHAFEQGKKLLQTKVVGSKVYMTAFESQSSMYETMVTLYAFDLLSMKLNLVGSYRVASSYVQQQWIAVDDDLYLSNGYYFDPWQSNLRDRPRIWKTSGATGDLVQVQNASLQASTPGAIWDRNLYYLASTGNQQYGLWRLHLPDGTPELIKALPANLYGIHGSPILSNDGAMYFVVRASYNTYTLWRSDGTAEGTREIDPQVIGDKKVPLVKKGSEIYYLQRGTNASANQLMRIEQDQEIQIVSRVPNVVQIDQWNDKILLISEVAAVPQTSLSDVTFYENDGYSEVSEMRLSYRTLEYNWNLIPIELWKTQDNLFYKRESVSGKSRYHVLTKSNSQDRPFVARDYLSLKDISFDLARNELGDAPNRDEKVEVPWANLNTEFRGMTVKQRGGAIYMVDDKNVHLPVTFWGQSNSQIENVFEDQGWFYILTRSTDADTRYTLYRWNESSYSAEIYYFFGTKPKIFRHRQGILFSGSSLLTISHQRGAQPRMIASSNPDAVMVISGRLFYISSGVIKHSDLQGWDEATILPSLPDAPAPLAGSIASHGDRLLFTSFINGTKQFVHSYPLLRYLQVQDVSGPDAMLGGGFYVQVPRRTFRATFTSTLGPATIYAEIRGPQAESFRLVGDVRWDQWKSGRSKLLEVEFQPQESKYYEAELVFVDASTDAVLSVMPLEGYHAIDYSSFHFSSSSGSGHLVAGEPIRLVMEPGLQKGRIGEIKVFRTDIVAGTYQHSFIAASEALDFMIPAQQAGVTYLRLLVYDLQGRIISDIPYRIEVHDPLYFDAEEREFEVLLGEQGFQLGYLGHFLLHQTSDQSFTYRMRLGASEWRGKGRFDDKGSVELSLKATRFHPSMTLPLQRVIDPETQKPALAARLSLPPYSEAFARLVPFREHTALDEASIGKMYAMHLRSNMVGMPTNILQEHPGYHVGFLEYRQDGSASLTLRHIRKKNLQLWGNVLSDGSVIFYQQSQGLIASIQLFDDSGSVQFQDVASNTYPYDMFLSDSVELAQPATEPYFVKSSSDKFISVDIFGERQISTIHFSGVPELASADLENDLGEAMQYEILQDGTVLGTLRFHGTTLPFVGLYYPASEYDGPKILGVVHKKGKWQADLEMRVVP